MGQQKIIEKHIKAATGQAVCFGCVVGVLGGVGLGIMIGLGWA